MLYFVEQECQAVISVYEAGLDVAKPDLDAHQNFVFFQTNVSSNYDGMIKEYDFKIVNGAGYRLSVLRCVFFVFMCALIYYNYYPPPILCIIDIIFIYLFDECHTVIVTLKKGQYVSISKRSWSKSTSRAL